MPSTLVRSVRILALTVSVAAGVGTSADPPPVPPERAEGYVVEGTLADDAWRGAAVVGRVIDPAGASRRVASGTVGPDGAFRLRLPEVVDPAVLGEVELGRSGSFGGCAGRVRVEDEPLRIAVLVVSVEGHDGTSAILDLADRSDGPPSATRVAGFLYAERPSAIRGIVACDHGTELDEVRYEMDLVRGWQPVRVRVEVLNAGHVRHTNLTGELPAGLVWRARP